VCYVLKASLQETEKEKAQFITSRNEAEEMMRVQADRLEQETRSLQRKDKALLMYVEQGRHAALEQCKSQKQEIERQSQELDRQRLESSSNVQHLNKSIASHQVSVTSNKDLVYCVPVLSFCLLSAGLCLS
jgi:DNA-binding PucR family transcriptional regulator